MITYDRNTPVLFIIFRRPETTAKVFEQIRKAAPKRLYIAADGPRNEEERIECEAARKVVEFIDWDCNVFRLYQEINLGCDKHCFQAISWFFEHEPEGIVLEDDCLPSYSFFGFCSTLLAKYRNDERIGHISGGNYQFGNKRGDGSYYFSNLTHVWGWAGWRRVWQSQCLSNNNFELFEKLDYLSYLPSHKEFHFYWNEMYEIANKNMDMCWDFRYAYNNLINNRLSIIPNNNLVMNIGCTEKATHYIENNPFADIKCVEMCDILHPSFIIPDIEADIYSQLIEYNMPSEVVDGSRDYLYLKNQLLSSFKEKHINLKIPKIVHQIYEDLAGPPTSLLKIAESWKELNPDWEYHFWNKNDIEVFLKEYYPELIDKYNAFPFNVQRWDAIRYLILYKFGGLYVDMDYECTENITSLFYNVECAMGLEPFGNLVRTPLPYIVGNAFMATIPGHPYFAELINEVFNKQIDVQKYEYIDELIVNTTGPYMTTRVYNNSRCKDNVTLIPGELVAPLNQYEIRKVINGCISKDISNKIERSFAIHYFFNSWTNQAKKYYDKN